MSKEVTLDQQIAYLLRNPITKPEQMPQQLIAKPIDVEWQKFIDQQWWAKKNTLTDLDPLDSRCPEKLEAMIKLRDFLLSFGGSEVCMPDYDEDAKRIVERGQLWYGDRVHTVRGRRSQCHANAASRWMANREKTVLCTGYALSEDGMWRCHSWLVELRARKNYIVETTTPRMAYFGFGMTTEEALDFYFENN